MEKQKLVMVVLDQPPSSSEEEAKQFLSTDMIRLSNDNSVYLSQLAHNTAYGMTLVHTKREESIKVAENKEHFTSKYMGSSQSRPFMPTFIPDDGLTQEKPIEDSEDAEILAKYQALGADFYAIIFFKDYLEVTKCTKQKKKQWNQEKWTMSYRKGWDVYP